MERYGFLIKVNDPKTYVEWHSRVPEDVLKVIKNAHISNYSIFLKDNYLFMYYEYTGDDYERDFAKLKEYPIYEAWCLKCAPLQEPIETCKKGEFWARMDSVFFLE